MKKVDTNQFTSFSAMIGAHGDVEQVSRTFYPANICTEQDRFSDLFDDIHVGLGMGQRFFANSRALSRSFSVIEV